MKKQKWRDGVFVTVTVLDDAELDITVEDENGSNIEYKKLTCDKANKYGAYLLIESDLNSVRKMIQLCLSKKDEKSSEQNIISHALFIAGIITYGKCYSTADGRKCSLESSHIFNENEKLLPIHNRMIGLRNQYVAHSGINKSEKSHIYSIKINSKKEPNMIKGLTSSATDETIHGLNDITSVVGHNIYIVKKKLDELKKLLENKYFNYMH